MDHKEKREGWNTKAWLWVLLFTAVIYSTIPLARTVQKSVYTHLGPEFFTYSVIFTVTASLAFMLYLLTAKLQAKNVSQYIWLIICGCLLVYYTVKLRKHPEEAVHLIEYGALSFLVFRALSFRIKDWTIYITTALIVSIAGTLDELLQWVTPTRVGHYKDVQLNAMSGLIGVLIISMGIRPAIIRQSVSRYSLKILINITVLAVAFIGLSLFLLVPDR